MKKENRAVAKKLVTSKSVKAGAGTVKASASLPDAQVSKQPPRPKANVAKPAKGTVAKNASAKPSVKQAKNAEAQSSVLLAKEPIAQKAYVENRKETSSAVKAEERLRYAQSEQTENSAEDLSNIGYDDQIYLFNTIKDIFSVGNDPNNNFDTKTSDAFFLAKMEETLNLAVEGNVVAQDYLTYLYKRGRDDMFGTDLIRAHQWGLLAISGGSKLSTDRLRLFFSPVYDFVEASGRAEDVIEINELEEETVLPYVASIMASLVMDEMGISLLSMSRLPMFTNRNESVEEFMRSLEAARNKNFDKMMQYLLMER